MYKIYNTCSGSHSEYSIYLSFEENFMFQGNPDAKNSACQWILLQAEYLYNKNQLNTKEQLKNWQKSKQKETKVRLK